MMYVLVVPHTVCVAEHYAVMNQIITIGSTSAAKADEGVQVIAGILDRIWLSRTAPARRLPPLLAS